MTHEEAIEELIKYIMKKFDVNCTRKEAWDIYIRAGYNLEDAKEKAYRKFNLLRSNLAPSGPSLTLSGPGL